MVSSLLNNVNDNVAKTYPMIAGLIGVGPAIEFRTWCAVYNDLPRMEDVFSGKATGIPHKTDAMYALVSSMTAYAYEHKNDMIAIGNSLSYAKRLPADFAELLVQNYRDFDKDYESFLLSVPEYTEYAAKRGRMRNGNVQ